MNALEQTIRAVERVPLPDGITQLGIEFLVGRMKRRLTAGVFGTVDDFARDMARRAIAEHVESANEQHYELPPEFFALHLGPRRKYSCCLYSTGTESLAEAEEAALEATIAHAALCDGQRILELGCGWGSLTLAMAERFRCATITAVSNSHSQRRHIDAEARARGLSNITVITADMNRFEAAGTFDRIVSVEMFEHISNWKSVLERARTWLVCDGRLFLHVFSHRSHAYRFDHHDKADWIARHFFTGGLMPSHRLIEQVTDRFQVEYVWRWSGEHYRRTALDWLANFDRNTPRIDAVLAQAYGAEAALWRRRWRLFYLATAGLFGHDDGEEWGVSHYLLHPAS
ncbi:MAG: SAM-dependent methyltransferase [Reyranellales bacterium]